MSATCPPNQFQEILTSLKITPDAINVHKGELTRPEIRFIRIAVARKSKLLESLKTFFPPQTAIVDSDLPKTLVYCQTQNDTFLALQAINSARENLSDTSNGLSSCVRRFHASTCPMDKAKRTEDFAAGLFPIMTCTNALGMGQNWPGIRRVIIVGMLDPLEVLQMAGRGGRDGRPAVAFLLVEDLSRSEQDSLDSVPDPTSQNNDHRMFAMTITGVCLRVGFAVLLR